MKKWQEKLKACKERLEYQKLPQEKNIERDRIMNIQKLHPWWSWDRCVMEANKLALN